MGDISGPDCLMNAPRLKLETELAKDRVGHSLLLLYATTANDKKE